MLHGADEHIIRIKHMADRIALGGEDLSENEQREIRFVMDGLVNSRIWNDKELSELLDLSKSTINKIVKGYPNVGLKSYNKCCSRLHQLLKVIRGSVVAISEHGVSSTFITMHNQNKKLYDVEGWYQISEKEYDKMFISVKDNIVKLIGALKKDNSEYIRSNEDRLILKSALISLLETSLSMLRPGGHIEVGFVKSVSHSVKEIVQRSSEAALGSGLTHMLDQVGTGLSELVKVFLK